MALGSGANCLLLRTLSRNYSRSLSVASDLVRGLDPADGLPYGLLDLSDMVLIRHTAPGPEKPSEAIPAPPGNDVDVEVGDALADLVVDGDESTVGVQAQFDRAGQHLDVREQEAD